MAQRAPFRRAIAAGLIFVQIQGLGPHVALLFVLSGRLPQTRDCRGGFPRSLMCSYVGIFWKGLALRPSRPLNGRATFSRFAKISEHHRNLTHVLSFNKNTDISKVQGRGGLGVAQRAPCRRTGSLETPFRRRFFVKQKRPQTFDDICFSFDASSAQNLLRDVVHPAGEVACAWSRAEVLA